MRINWKKVTKIGFEIGKQLFPILNAVESFSHFKDLSSKEKQDAAFNVLKDQLVSTLLPDQVQKVTSDPRFEAQVRKIIDDGVALNNLIAEILANEQ